MSIPPISTPVEVLRKARGIFTVERHNTNVEMADAQKRLDKARADFLILEEAIARYDRAIEAVEISVELNVCHAYSEFEGLDCLKPKGHDGNHGDN